MADEYSLIARLRTFLLDPDTFFRNLSEQLPRYRGPIRNYRVARSVF